MTEDKDKSIKHKEVDKAYWKLRLEVMHKLGGKCEKCGETDIRVLQIAHKGVKSLGNSYKRKDAKNTGIYLYKGIINGEVDRDEVELLCSNCNILYEFEIERRSFPTELPVNDVELASKMVGKYKRSPKMENPVTIACSKETKQRMIDLFGKEGTWNDVIHRMIDEFEWLSSEKNVKIKAK